MQKLVLICGLFGSGTTFLCVTVEFMFIKLSVR